MAELISVPVTQGTWAGTYWDGIKISIKDQGKNFISAFNN